MPKGITNSQGLAHTALLTLQQNGYDVSMGNTHGIYVIVSSKAPDSTFNSLGLSLQLTST